MKETNRYFRNGVFAVLAIGVTVTGVAGYQALGSVDSGYHNRFWGNVAGFGVFVSGIGLLGWLCLTFPRVGSDLARVWRVSRTTALVTLAVFAAVVIKLYRFTGPHFYGWDDPNAWLFFAVTLLLAAYLLLKAALWLIDTLKM